MTREHGGNLDAAIAQYGGAADDWIDLSTGINRLPYPLPPLEPRSWATLPTQTALTRTLDVARAAYGQTTAAGIALSGAQAAIQLLPWVLPQGSIVVLTPTYNEHAAAFRANDWQVVERSRLVDLKGAEIAVVVNPNNPDGCKYEPAALRALAAEVGTLIVDESFADPTPETSLLTEPLPPNAIILRSFGKFFGLAGLRLGFAFGPETIVQTLAERAGPWAVNGPALAIGAHALRDADWQAGTRDRLAADTARLDTLALARGWQLLGGTALFRTYDTGDGAAAQAHLARHHIWSRAFAAQPRWLRLGLPGPSEWSRIEAALKALADRPAVAPER